MASQPAAFMSYARFDDQHEDGQLSQFRERLAAEIRVQTGREFPIFQDRADVAWGENWQQRIDDTLDEVTLLLAILTPSFFHSPACRSEVLRFLERERKLGRQDLILPVYYVSTPELDDPVRFGTDELAQTMAARQYADWRELRFEPLTSPVTRRAIAQLADRMRNPFWRPRMAVPVAKGLAKAPRATMPRTDGAGQVDLARQMAKTEPPTHVVDQYLRGDFATIAMAIRAARPGDRILVRPGLYRESLVINKPLEIIGDGPVADIEIQVRDADAVQFAASIGRVANLTIRQAGGEGDWYAVVILQGRLELEGCDISSRGVACVGIFYGADPRLRHNAIHDGAGFGVVVSGQSLGTLEDNDIFVHEERGVIIVNSSDPTLRRNAIRGNKRCGVAFETKGRGVLEDNDISGNGYSGVEIMGGSNPMLRHNAIHDNGGAGAYAYEEGLGTLEDNDITDNENAGVLIDDTGSLTVRGNRINRNLGHAVVVHAGGKGVLEDNDLADNQQGAWFLGEGSEVDVTRARNRE